MFATFTRVDVPTERQVKVNPRHVVALDAVVVPQTADDDAEAQGESQALLLRTTIYLSTAAKLTVRGSLSQTEAALEGRAR